MSKERIETGIERAGDWIMNQLLAHQGVEERKSRFGDKEALFFRGTEFFHLDRPGLADVRLGRQTIREHIAELRSDPQVELRASSSDWIRFHFTSIKDATCALKWGKVAIGVDD